MMFSFFIVQETLYLYDKKRSAGIAYAAEWNDVAYVTRRRRRILQAIGRKSERRSCMEKKDVVKNGIRKTVCKTVQLRCLMRQAAFFLRMQLERNESLVFGRF